MNRPRGFTMIECLIVVATIGAAIALALPAVQKAREASRRSRCANNLQQLVLAMHNYHHAWKKLPSTLRAFYLETGWTTDILPYIGEEEVWKLMDRYCQDSWSMHTCHLSKRPISLYLCASAVTADQWTHDPREASEGVPCYTHHYYGVQGPFGINPATGQTYSCGNDWTSAENTAPNQFGQVSFQGMFPRHSAKFPEVTDGLSNTFLLGEISWHGNGLYRQWSRSGLEDTRGRLYWSSKTIVHPLGSQFALLPNQVAFGSNHPGGANFVMGDGCVRFVADSIDFGVYLAAASRDGKEATGDPK